MTTTPSVTVKLDAESLRARTKALKLQDVTYSVIANRANVALAQLSVFVGGGKWGSTLMGRLAIALDSLEAEQAAKTVAAPASSPAPSARPAGDTIPVSAPRPTSDGHDDIPDTLQPGVIPPLV